MSKTYSDWVKEVKGLPVKRQIAIRNALQVLKDWELFHDELAWTRMFVIKSIVEENLKGSGVVV